MSEHDESEPGTPVLPAASISAEDMDGRLRSLAETLRRRGLQAKLVSYLTDGVRNKNYDAITVTNPSAPERGSMQIEKAGLVIWDFFGSLDSPGVDRIADEATNALRATGVSRTAR